MPRYILMSFKPLYALEIINGLKDCEVRTYSMAIDPGDKVVVYASAPLKEILGEFTVRDVFIDRYNSVANFVRERCSKFDQSNWDFIDKHYSKSFRKLAVLMVADVVRYRVGVPLGILRKFVPNFIPPMSYIYIDIDLYELIRRVVESGWRSALKEEGREVDGVNVP